MTKHLRPFTLFVALLGALLAPAACADPQASAPSATAQPAPASEAKPEQARPALWKVADKDTTIWLFGTIHVLPPGVEWLDGKVAKAFHGSQQLVTEIVEPDPETMKAEFLKRALLPQGQNLREQLAAEDRAQYEAALARLGLPMGTFDAFEPWYAAVTLSLLPLLQDGYASDQGVDAALVAQAKARHLPHEGLETPEFQLDVFDHLPLDVQKRYLDEVVEDMPSMKDELKAMVTAWKRGDADALAKLINAPEDDPVLIEALLTNRNRNWADWIGKRLAKPGTVFIAVGAGHLAGSNSVQAQLQARGITSKRVQ